MKTKLLLVEDEQTLSELLTEFLIAENYEVYNASNGKEGYVLYKSHQPDVCIFDVMMPKMSGFSLLEKIREIDNTIPIILLTAKALKDDVIKGLELGADDYMTKPFNFQELNLRLKNVLKRKKPSDNKDILSIGKYTFNACDQTLKFNTDTQALTAMESNILNALNTNRNNTVERKDILQNFWNLDDPFNFRSIDVYVSKLRKYLSKDESIKIISTRGKGYKLIVQSN